VDAVSKQGIGSYRVDFTQTASTCAYIASQSKTGTGTAPPEPGGFAEAAAWTGATDQLNVFTFDKGGSTADRSFHIAVFC